MTSFASASLAIPSPGLLAASHLLVMNHILSHSCVIDANTIGCIATVACIDWSGAVHVMAAAGICTSGSFAPTDSEMLSVILMYLINLL